MALEHWHEFQVLNRDCFVWAFLLTYFTVGIGLWIFIRDFLILFIVRFQAVQFKLEISNERSLGTSFSFFFVRIWFWSGIHTLIHATCVVTLLNLEFWKCAFKHETWSTGPPRLHSPLHWDARSLLGYEPHAPIQWQDSSEHGIQNQ